MSAWEQTAAERIINHYVDMPPTCPLPQCPQTTGQSLP
jgi:hypothetical protein